MSLVLQSFLPFPHGCQGPSPHQQGRDARMIEQCFGGIDVSHDRLDVLLLPQATRFSVANDEPGWNALIARLRGLPVAAIGLELSGGYERGVIRALLAASSRRDLFAPALAAVGLHPDRVIYAETHRESEVLAATEEGLRHKGLAGDLISRRRTTLSS